MKRYFLCITIIAFVLFSCGKTKQGDLLEIPIDIYQDNLIPLSEIAEEVIAIELEATDESLISPMSIRNIIISENEVFIATMNRILVFNKTGKFIRVIGSRGQGPGEFNHIRRFTLDEKNKHLFIISYNQKIISYDLNGNFLKETFLFTGILSDINFINEKLLLLINKLNKTIPGFNEIYSHSALYRLDDNLRIVDSCTIRDLYFKASSAGFSHWNEDFILKGGKSIYLYYGDFFDRENSTERVFCDTLYRFENNYLIPDLKLKFKNKFIKLYNIYRSSRYIFAVYENENNKNICFFCYDTKTGKGYNINTQDGNGFSDDINGIDERVRIRPLNSDTEMFYYLHTHMKPDDLEEPNPTLYIGKLKK